MDNKRIRDEVHKEMQDLAKKRADEMAHELAKKAELIRQIRELEKMYQALEKVAAACDGSSASAEHCSILQALASDETAWGR